MTNKNLRMNLISFFNKVQNVSYINDDNLLPYLKNIKRISKLILKNKPVNLTKLTSLIRLEYYNRSLCPYTYDTLPIFPKSLKYLQIGTLYKLSPCDLSYLDNIIKLKLSSNITNISFPISLNFLHLHSVSTVKLPDNIKTLKLSGTPLITEFENKKLPKNLKVLIIKYEFNNYCTKKLHLPVLPQSLEEFYFNDIELKPYIKEKYNIKVFRQIQLEYPNKNIEKILDKYHSKIHEKLKV